MSDDYNPDVIQNLDDLRSKRAARPWQLLTAGDGCGQLDARTLGLLEHILELLPSVSYLIVETRSGPVQVSRDFPSGYIDAVDKSLASIFQHDPEVKGIAFPTTGTGPGHTATPDDPYWSSTGKAAADIEAAHKRGEITSEDAVARIVRLHRPEPA